jgi:hypothetical protein
MDIASIAAALVARQAAQAQMAVAAKILKMNAPSADNAVKLIEAAQKNLDSVANLAVGIGENLDVTV